MIKLLQEGGFPILFVLLFGLVSLGLAVRVAISPTRRRLHALIGMGLCTFFATLAGTAANFGAVFHNLSGQGRLQGLTIRSPEGVEVLLLGFGESMSTPLLGFALLSMAALVAAVGARRAGADLA